MFNVCPFVTQCLNDGSKLNSLSLIDISGTFCAYVQSLCKYPICFILVLKEDIYINMACKNCIKPANPHISHVGEENRTKTPTLNELGDWQFEIV